MQIFVPCFVNKIPKTLQRYGVLSIWLRDISTQIVIFGIFQQNTNNPAGWQGC